MTVLGALRKSAESFSTADIPADKKYLVERLTSMIEGGRLGAKTYEEHVNPDEAHGAMLLFKLTERGDVYDVSTLNGGEMPQLRSIALTSGSYSVVCSDANSILLARVSNDGHYGLLFETK